MSEVVATLVGKAGQVTLNRPKALNALSLDMVRELLAVLQRWRDDPRVEVVAIRGQGREGAFGAFSAGGDIRFFHQAALAGDLAALDAFFTQEYQLNHLVHHYPKPCVAFMDGIVFGGGMGISQGARSRIVTERTKVAMPETVIGLFPDVGGGYFLSRCPGRLGEYLALTGETLGAEEAVDARLADLVLSSVDLPALWDRLAVEGAEAVPAPNRVAGSRLAAHRVEIDRVFALPSVVAILEALESGPSDWHRDTAALLRKRSPLMLHVTLEQVRRARTMTLADDLRMERDIVWHCFRLRPGAAGETVEGIRALAIDKDHAPRWNPSRAEDVTPEQVGAFFRSPWAPAEHPLRGLA
jgi:enoyl-CoA hydratase/carnithine racemase